MLCSDEIYDLRLDLSSKRSLFSVLYTATSVPSDCY